MSKTIDKRPTLTADDLKTAHATLVTLEHRVRLLRANEAAHAQLVEQIAEDRATLDKLGIVHGL